MLYMILKATDHMTPRKELSSKSNKKTPLPFQS